jgi:hypothetical protein
VDLGVLQQLSVTEKALQVVANSLRNYLLNNKQAVTDMWIRQQVDPGITISDFTSADNYIDSNLYEFPTTFNVEFRSTATDVSAGVKTLIDPLGNEYEVEAFTGSNGSYYPVLHTFSSDDFKSKGDWIIKDGDEILVIADPSAPSDFIEGGNVPVGYIPEFRLDIAADNTINGVHIRWLLQHPDGTVTEANQQAVSLGLVGVFIQFNGGGFFPDPTPHGSEGGTIPIEPGDDYIEWPVTTAVENLSLLEFKWSTYAVMYNLYID